MRDVLKDTASCSIALSEGVLKDTPADISFRTTGETPATGGGFWVRIFLPKTRLLFALRIRDEG